MLEVALNTSLPLRVARLAVMRGHEELSSAGAGALGNTANQLLLALLARAPAEASQAHVLQPSSFSQLSLSDRDRLLVAVFSHAFGDQISGKARCNACAQDFELGFSLSAFASRSEPLALPQVSDALGVFTSARGIRFRAPRVEDEQALDRVAAEERLALLMQRCLLERSEAVPAAQLESELDEELQRVAPLVRGELTVPCGDCQASQQVDFDIESYLVLALRREQPLLLREVHVLASKYHWPLTEILNLSRSERRGFVAMVLAEGGLAA